MYGNVADWKSYALARGDSAPTNASEEAASQSLTRASDYVRTRYVLPLGLTADSEAVVEATYIAASLDLPNPGFWAKTFTPAETKVLTEVKGIKWTVANSGVSGPDAHLPTSPAIEALFIGDRAYSVGIFVV